MSITTLRHWCVGIVLLLAQSAGARTTLGPVSMTDWTIDAGAAWVARPDLQWDVSAGHTFHDRGEVWFVSAGITLRHR